jgi:LysR family glycine cleavage system transcriptional activator
MRRLPPLAAVRVFEAAARVGNFTRAAEELGMTQAAVSYQVKLLEERLGAPLFARSGRGVALTELGRRIAPQVTSAFDTLGDAFASVRAESEAVLTISATHTFSSNWLAGRLGAFQLQRPALAVRLSALDAIVDFGQGEADVAIRTSRAPWPGLVSHFLMRVPYTPLASPAFLTEHPVREPADIFRYPRLSPEDLWWDAWYQLATGKEPDGPQPRGIRLDSQILEGNAAIAGQGVAILNPLMWEPQIAAGLLVQPLPQFRMGRHSFWLVYPESKRGLAKVRAFRDWLLAEVVRAAGEDRFGVLAPPEEA